MALPLSLKSLLLQLGLRHEAIGDPTLVDATLDTLVHITYGVDLKGEWMRKPLQRKRPTAR